MTQRSLLVRDVTHSQLKNDAQFSPPVWKILAGRGVSSFAETDYKLSRMLPVDAIRNLPEAAKLLAATIQQKKQILIFGDYDADGATSTALCVRALTLMGHHNVSYLMPDRFINGYGLSVSIAHKIAEAKPDCVITVDNGIASINGIALLRAQNIDVIVTDHHLPADELPNANVIINQNAWPDETVGKNLAGVGVSFYLMLGIRKALRDIDWFNQQRIEPNLASCLDLVAIGTVADLVPLDFHNRLLVNEGLRRIRAGHCSAGIQSLIEISNKQLTHVTSTDIGFSIAPKINAAGRLEDMTSGVQCLLADDQMSADGFANQLNDINQLRKDIQQTMADEAQLQLAKLSEPELHASVGIVLFQKGWHEGIVGIVASKVKEKYHRPCIVFAEAEDGVLKGSGRSISGVHLRDILDVVDKRYPGIILKFGGHAMAAGLSLKADAFDLFSTAFQTVISDLVDPACFTNSIECDGLLDSQYLTIDFAKTIQNLTPWGQRFPSPSFVGEFEVTDSRILAQKHIKFELKQNSDTSINRFEAIAFFQPTEVLEANHDNIHIHYELNINHFRNRESLQLLIRDIL
jgi:single-stranded-DNA-specific exonuclease